MLVDFGCITHVTALSQTVCCFVINAHTHTYPPTGAEEEPAKKKKKEKSEKKEKKKKKVAA